MKPASSIIIPGILPLLSLVFLTGCNPCQETLDKQKATHQLTLEQKSTQHQSVLTEKQTNISGLNQKIDTQKAQQNKLQSHIAEQKKELQDRQSRIDKQEQDLQNKQTQIETQEKELHTKQAHISTQEQELQKRQAQIVQHEQDLSNKQNHIKQQTDKLLKQQASLEQSQQKADNLANHLNKSTQQDLLHVQQIAVLKDEVVNHIQLEEELTLVSQVLEQKLLEERIKLEQAVEANHLMAAELQKQKQLHSETLQQKAELEQTVSNLQETLESTQEALVNRGMQLAQQEQKIAMAQTDVEQTQQTLAENNALLAAKDDLIHGLQMRLSEVTINKQNNLQGTINIPSIYAASDPKVKAEVNALFSRLAIARDEQIELSQKLIHTQEKLADTQEQLKNSLKQYKTLQNESDAALKLAVTELVVSEEALIDVTQKLQEQLALSQELELITQEQHNKIEILNAELSTAVAQSKQLSEELAGAKQELKEQLIVSQELSLMTQELELITQQQQQRIQTLEADRDLAIEKIMLLTEQLITSEEALSREKQELKKQISAFKELALISNQQQQQLQSLAEKHKTIVIQAHNLTGELHHANKKLAVYEQDVLDATKELKHQLTISEKLEATTQLQVETIQTLEVKLSKEEQALYSVKQELQEQLAVYQESELITHEQQKRIQLLETKLTTAEAQVYQINDELKQAEIQLTADKQALEHIKQELLDLQDQQQLNSQEAQAMEQEAKAREAAKAEEEARIAQAKAKAEAEAEKNKEIYHIVKSGDTLAKIAIQYYDNAKLYKLIQKANNMDNPNTIELGQKLLIPKP